MKTYRNESIATQFLKSQKLRYWLVRRLDTDAGRSHNIKTDNSFFEGVEQFKYLGTTLTNQNAIQEEIRSRFK